MLDALNTHSVNQLLAEAFRSAGYCLFLVGGSVRDALCGTPDFSDLDYTTEARPDQILAVVSPLGPTWTVGEEFGTICVSIETIKVEITTFRTEAYEELSRKPVVAFGDTIADDLKRRDLTINALALCLVSDGTYVPGELVDLYGGASDLSSGLLRTPDEANKTVSEDPLRQLRAIRFAVKREMEIVPELRAAIQENAQRLSIVAVERSCEELRKILDAGPAATLAAVLLAEELGVKQFLTGSLVTDSALETLRRLESGDRITLLAAFADSTFSVMEDAEAAFKALKLSNEEIRPALQVARTLRKFPVNQSLLEARLLVRSTDPETLARTLLLARPAGVPVHLVELIEDVSKESFVRASLPVNGNDLLKVGLKGPSVGAALERVTEEFLLNPSLTRDEALTLVVS